VADPQDFQGMGLYDFQEEGAAFLASRRYGLLADRMGRGKTGRAIAAAR